MKRLFNLAAVVSLVLCVATVALWIRSFFVGELPGWVGQQSVYVRSERGAIHPIWFETDRGLPHGWNYMSWKPDPPNWHPAGFEYYRGVSQPLSQRGFRGLSRGGNLPFAYVGINIPYWSMALLFAILPTFWLPHVLRQRCRRQTEQCRNCGYDLRATPDRCPECGTAVAAPAMPLGE